MPYLLNIVSYGSSRLSIKLNGFNLACVFAGVVGRKNKKKKLHFYYSILLQMAKWIVIAIGKQSSLCLRLRVLVSCDQFFALSKQMNFHFANYSEQKLKWIFNFTSVAPFVAMSLEELPQTGFKYLLR